MHIDEYRMQEVSIRNSCIGLLCQDYENEKGQIFNAQTSMQILYPGKPLVAVQSSLSIKNHHSELLRQHKNSLKDSIHHI